jgi:ankyrin repeat protein
MLRRLIALIGTGCFLGFTLFAAPTPGELELAKVQELLWDGRQRDAEELLELAVQRFPNSEKIVFLKAACARSRFDVTSAARVMGRVVEIAPGSVEGLCAACVLGIDFAGNSDTAMWFLGGIAALGRAHPDELPVRWMAGVMARTLAVKYPEMSWSQLRSIRGFGVDNFKGILARIGSREGTSLIHQTCANLLEDLEALGEAHAHRLTAVKLERAPWSLDGLAGGLNALNRCPEALVACEESLRMVEAARLPVPADPKASRERAFAEARNAECDRSASTYHNRRAEILMEMDDVTGSVAERVLAMKLHPQDRSMNHYLARLFPKLGDWENAGKHARQAIEDQYEAEANSLWLLKMEVRAGVPGSAGALELVQSAGNQKSKGNNALKSPVDRWFWAVENGDKTLFEQLANQVDINIRDDSKIKGTALVSAVQNGNIHLIADLIRMGADLNATDVNGDTALNHAAQFNQPAAMRLLLEAGADTGIQDKWKQTPLVSAAGDKHNRAAVRLLLQHGADTEIATPHGGTPLNYAAGWGDLPIIQALIRSGANPECPAVSDGSTPLISSCRNQHVQAAEALLMAGARVDARDKFGRTALHSALLPTPNRPLIALLLANGADPFALDSDGVSCVKRARFLGYDDLALEFEAAAGKTEELSFPGDEIMAAGDFGKRAADLLSLPVALFHGALPSATLFAHPKKQNITRADLKLLFGIQNLQQLNSTIKNFGSFEPSYADDFGMSAALSQSIGYIGARYSSLGEDEEAWGICHRIYLLQQGVEAGFLKKEQASPRIAREVDLARKAFLGWGGFSKSFLTGAFRHCGWQFERYVAICLHLTDPKVAGHPWADESWR